MSYRPISLISCLSKLFEIINTKTLTKWAEDNEIIPPEQNGFREHRSCDDSLFEMAQLAMQNLNRGRKLAAVFFDIEKAFDKVWHGGLLHRLIVSNCPVLLVRWISSYLQNRKIKVKIGNNISGTISANYGVPQGSPISPLLFIIFFSHFQDLTHKRKRYRSMYADDLAISESVKADIHSYSTALTTLGGQCQVVLIRSKRKPA